MAPIDHWHPVVVAGTLKMAPLPFKLLGQDYVLFRTPAGPIGALEDRCPHRHFPLSCGEVLGDRLRCQYHGWNYGHDGAGVSPGNPGIRVRAKGLEAVERHGMVWVRRRGASTPFPRFDIPDYASAGQLLRRAEAPVMLVMDNFCEVEHTGTVHALFGYDLGSLKDIQTRVERGETYVRVVNQGPQKPIPKPLYPLFAIQEGDDFVDDWTTHFSPLHCVYDQYWVDPATGAERPDKLRVYVFFNPIDDQTTDIVTLAYSFTSRFIPPVLAQVTMKLLKTLLAREVELDVAMLSNYKDKRGNVKEMSLGRFDKALILNRRLARRIYYGDGTKAGPEDRPEEGFVEGGGPGEMG